MMKRFSSALWLALLMSCMPMMASAQDEDGEGQQVDIQAETTDEAPMDGDLLMASEDEDVDILSAEALEGTDEDAFFLDASEESADVIEIVPGEESEMVSELSLPDPLYTVESIRITGNRSISEERLLKIMGVHKGDRIQLKSLEDAKMRMTMAGAVDAVDMQLTPGSETGTVRVDVSVEDKIPVQVNDYYIGLSKKSTAWAGLNTSWLNMFGTGQRFDMAFVATPEDEYSWRVNYAIPHVAGSMFSLAIALNSMSYEEDLFVRNGVSEEYRDEVTFNDKLRIRKHGFSISSSVRPLPNLGVYLSVQSDLLQRDDARVQEIKLSAVDDFIHKGFTPNTKVAVTVAFDSRTDYRMPATGHMVGLGVSGTFRSKASDYKYIKATLFHQSNFLVAPEHVLRLASFAGAIVGDAPYYEKFRFEDFYMFTPNRVVGLNPSSTGAIDLFKTGAGSLGYEDFLATIAFEYAWQHHTAVPGLRMLEIFARVNAVYADSLEVSPLSLGVKPDFVKRSAFPCDASVDVGARFNTEFGFFKFSLAYVLNMVPR